MKRLTSWLVVLMLLVGTVPALAARGDAEPFRRTDGVFLSIRSAAVAGDALYVLDDMNGIARYRVYDAAPVEIELVDTAGGSWPTMLVGQGDRLYAICELYDPNGSGIMGAQLVRLQFLDDTRAEFADPIALDWSVMLDDSYGEMSSRYYTSCVMTEDALYLLVRAPYEDVYSLVAFDLSTGKATEHVIRDLQGIALYKDGQLLVQLRDARNWEAPARVGILDPRTMTVTESSAFVDSAGHNSLNGLLYDDAVGRLYYVSERSLYACEGLDNSVAQRVNDMPFQADLGSSATLLPGGFYVFYNNDVLAVRNVNPEDIPSRTLTIAGGDAEEAYYAFRAANPDVSIDLRYPQSDEDIIGALMNRDGSVDVYLVNLSGAAYRAMRERGYAVELTHDAAKDRAGRMYPVARDALMAEGKLIAMPAYCYGRASFYFNPTVLEKLGMTEADLPGTWAEAIDFLARWDDTIGIEHPDITPIERGTMADARAFLAGLIITDYLTWLNVDGVERKFDTPVLRGLLDKLDAADLPRDTQQTGDDDWSWDEDTALLNQWGLFGFSMYNQHNDTLPLSLTDELPAYMGLDLSAYVINPFSPDQDIAQAFLAACAEQMPRDLKGMLCPDEDEPIHVPYYAQYSKDVERTIEDLTKQIAEADAIDRPALEEMRKSVQADFDEYARTAWATSPDDVARYRKLAEHLAVLTFDVYFRHAPEFSTLFERYAARQIDAGQLLQGFDQRVHMMAMEDE